MARGLAGAALLGLAAWFLLQAAALYGWDIGSADVRLLLYAIVLPALAAVTIDAMARFGRGAPDVPLWIAILLGGGGAGVALLPDVLQVGGAAALAAGGTVLAIRVMSHAPKVSLVNEDPLTKGDDACFKHIVFAHRFLPLALLTLVAAEIPGVSPRVGLIASHLFVVGYILLSVYALAHLWVPRFSGVPAIAAGAIKGELHSSLLGIVGLVLGFALASPGILMGLGFFVFVGFFTFMGVIGANMMRNKSKTQRVTPEFAYIPWMFTAVFWLICAVLMGLFLNAVPDALADERPGLGMMHLTAGLLAGVVQVLLAILTRAIPQSVGAPLLPFAGAHRFAFFAFNVGIAIWITGTFSGAATTQAIGMALLVLGLAAFATPVLKLMRAVPHAAA